MLLDELEKGWEVLSHEGRVSFFATSGQRPTGGKLGSLSSLARAVTNLEGHGYDIYLGANPSNHRGIKSRTRDITEWKRVVLDLDPVGPIGNPHDALNDIVGLADSIVSGCRECATGVYTGRGIQAWLQIEPYRFDTADRATVERGMSAFLHQLAREWENKHNLIVDTTTSDLARVVRCPGSVNQDTGNHAKILFTGSRKPLALEIITMAIKSPESAVKMETGAKNLREALPHLNDLTTGFLTRGSYFPRRHHDAFAAAKNLQEVGIPLDKAREWIVAAARYCTPYDERLIPELERCAVEAYKER